MFYRDTWAQIDLDRFTHNIDVMKKHTKKDIFCVVKANAYGHGDYQIASEAMACGCKYVAVSSLDEAIALRMQGFEASILVLGYIKAENIEIAIEKDITLTVVSREWAEAICELKDINGLKVHLKVDTGMNRIGMKKFEDLQVVLNLLLSHDVNVEGIYTHFHSADKEDKSSCETQKKWFYHILDSLNYEFTWIHTSNSDASISFEVDRCNAIRVGLALYGVKDMPSALDLKPVLSLYSRVTCVKEVQANETVGYGATYRCRQKEWIATLPIGYGDGFIRANQGRFVCIDAHPYEIVGRICMDQCMIRLDKKYPVGSEVEIIGDYISVETMAHELNTIPYEILCLLNDRIPRVFLKNKEIIGSLNIRIHK